jgi:divalent metal cation (Fe/Co/Zn/Cd) transporter
MNDSTLKFYRKAFALAVFTIVYNLIEGVVAVYFGLEDGSLTLSGFGVDSFIEMISGFGIAHMIIRIRSNPGTTHDQFERTALRITGISFYILALGLIISAIRNLVTHEQPGTTLAGLIISVLSIAIMIALMSSKLAVGRALGSAPVIADARCTKICIYMSLVLLASSGIYELTKIPWIDPVGSLGLAWLSIQEGRESMMKSHNASPCGCEQEEKERA